MKIDWTRLSPRQFQDLKRGAVLQVTRHGAYLRARPKPPKHGWSQKQIDNRKRFGLAGNMASNPHPLDLATAIEFAKGTEQVPRDILTMAALGSYFIIENPDGTEWPRIKFPRVNFASELPDDMWTYCAYDAAWSGSLSTFNNAWFGAVVNPEFTYDITALRFICRGGTAYRYRCVIADLDSSRKITALTETMPTWCTTTGRQMVGFNIAKTLNAGSKYWLAYGVDNQLSTTNPGYRFVSGDTWFPRLDIEEAGGLAVTYPSIGDTISTSSFGSPAMGAYITNPEP